MFIVACDTGVCPIAPDQSDSERLLESWEILWENL